MFAWSHSDMKGVDPDVMCHRLNIDPRHPARQQKRRWLLMMMMWTNETQKLLLQFLTKTATFQLKI